MKKFFMIIVSIFMIVLYCFGVYELFMLLSHNEGFYLANNYGANVIDYFTNYPVYYLALWMLFLICGLMSSFLLIFNDGYAKGLSLLSFISELLLIILSCIFSNRIMILGTKKLIIDIVFLMFTLGLFIFCCKYFKIEKTEKK